MGVENNECVIATTWNPDVVKSIKQWVLKLSERNQSLFAYIPALENNKTTIILAPDGSKKNWATAKETATLRELFISFLETFNYDDNSSPLDYVEVGYGEFGQKVLRGNCENCYDDREYCTLESEETNG